MNKEEITKEIEKYVEHNVNRVCYILAIIIFILSLFVTSLLYFSNLKTIHHIAYGLLGGSITMIFFPILRRIITGEILENE